ncbi:hypothetical protein [Pseudotabrizicola sp. 4114]|uniref:hypothetical protein n=1 Tax=Pseudotabrizicola sp. 4114 TaxID=2817731 RepID=UPI002861080E|nr:hypothetical protein [Pseudorhodobacter sp. 4114]
MILQRKLTLVVATGAIALGAGHYVQEKAGDRATAEPLDMIVSDVVPVAAGPADVTLTPTIIEPPALPVDAAPIVKVPAPVTDAPPERFAAADPAADLVKEAQPMPAPAMAPPPDCTVRMDLLPQPDAMIGLSLLAPCHADQRVVLKHAGLAVTARTSASGALIAALPALTAVAEVEVILTGGEKVRASVPMPDFAGVQRFAVQWQDADAFQLHAFENGAGYNQPGHISAAYTGTSGESGVVTLLGDGAVNLPLLAEVYTFGPAQKTELVLEAEVTENTCGREILGEAILATGGSVEITDLTLSMPDCDAVGDILVLKNLLQDMTLAIAN